MSDPVQGTRESRTASIRFERHSFGDAVAFQEEERLILVNNITVLYLLFYSADRRCRLLDLNEMVFAKQSPSKNETC